MRRYLLLTILIVLILFGRSKIVSNTNPNPAKACTPAFKAHTTGTVWTVESNYGVFGDPNADQTGNPSYDWPGGLGYYYLWEGRLWIGAKVGENVYVSHADYGNYEFSPSEDPTENCGWLTISYPKSQQDIISAYTDYEGYYNNPYKLGLKVIQKAFQWSMSPYNQFIGYEIYVIYNKSKFNITGVTAPTILKNVFVSLCFDADNCDYDETNPHIDDMVAFDGDTRGEWDHPNWYLPSPTDHYTILADTTIEEPDGVPDQYQIWGDDPDETVLTPGTKYYIPRNMSYIYDDDDPTTPENDKTEGGGCPGYIFARLIYAPPAKFDWYDVYGAGSRVPTVYSHQWWNWNNDPGTDENKYAYMSATHDMSLGYYFMPIPYDVGAATFDYRFLLTSGPHQIEDGDTLKLVYVAGVGFGLNGGYDSKFGNGYVLGARQVADAGLKAYYMGSKHSDPAHPSAPDEDIHWQIPLPPEVPELTYYIDEGKVELRWDNKAETTPDPIDGAYDFVKYRVYRATWKPMNWELLAEFDKSALQHSFVDTTLIPGIPYYYAVTASDSGRPAQNIPPLETGKSNYKKDAKGAPVPLILLPPSSSTLDNVKVVPNPYYGSASWEPQYEDKIAFTNLPPNARVIIYTISGDKLYTIENRSATGTVFWNMVSDADIKVASGLYIYKVEQYDSQGNIVDYKVDKFIILR